MARWRRELGRLKTVAVALSRAADASSQRGRYFGLVDV
jgi:hypothetical protein